MTYKGKTFSGEEMRGQDFEEDIFSECKIEQTKLDVQGFLDFGVSKGFVLEN